jgi:hypothetical protein
VKRASSMEEEKTIRRFENGALRKIFWRKMEE